MKKRILSTAAGLGLAAVAATTLAAPAQAWQLAGGYSTLSSCNSARNAYIKDGGFSSVGSCFKYGSYYFFQYG